VALRRSHIFLIAWASTAIACGSGVGPTPVVEEPIVSCPSDVAVTGHNGQMPTVSFDTPVAERGVPPLSVVCTPASGTRFPSGRTPVTCEVTDARAHKASCSFSVVVTAVPQLLKTKFLAFGDSLTEGKIRLLAPGIIVVPPGYFNSSASYVEQLNTKLTARYQDQAITIVASGWGGEAAGEGKLRLPGALATYNPDVLLLLEGTNDLLHSSTVTAVGMQAAIDSVVDALQNMIRQGHTRGLRVFVATLPTITRTAHLAAGVVTLNARIRSLAAQEKATLVDLHTVVPASRIGADGLHPDEAGYRAMADEWLKAITATLETPSP
jgi:lysophospholipase L1-like esterase